MVLQNANTVAKGINARTVEVLELLSVNIAVFSRIVKTPEDVRCSMHGEERSACKACTSSTARSVA